MADRAPPVKTFGELSAARKAGRKVELSAEQRALSEKVKRAFARRPPKLVEQQQETIGTVERLSPRRRRVFSSLKLNMGARLLRGRPHGTAPRTTSRASARTRRPTRRATSARRTSRSGARGSPSGLASDDPEPADGSAHQPDLTTCAYRGAS